MKTEKDYEKLPEVQTDFRLYLPQHPSNASETGLSGYNVSLWGIHRDITHI